MILRDTKQSLQPSIVRASSSILDRRCLWIRFSFLALATPGVPVQLPPLGVQRDCGFAPGGAK